MDTPTEERLDVVEWLRAAAVPVHSVEFGSGFADLQALRPVFEGAKIIGLGESAHGVRDFYRLKHRLVEFLVEELGFTAIALEASYAGCQPINDYLLRGVGDRADVLTGQHYMAWDTEEFAALLDWLRAHNQGAAEDRKVAFYGLDTGFNSVGRYAVRDYLARVAPERLASIDATFATLEELESRWPFRLDDRDATAISGCHNSLEELLNYLGSEPGEIMTSATARERDRIREFVRVMWQWTESGSERSRHMGENLVQIHKRERPGCKLIVWAANAHIGRRMLFHDDTGLGDVAVETFGDAYRPFGLEFGDGRFQSRTLTADREPSELVETVMTPPPEGSLPWYLSRVGIEVFAVDTRTTAATSVQQRWLTSELLEHGCMWYYTDPATLYHNAKAAHHYDGIFFVQHITAARPTEKAMQGAALGERF
jgi:erythromycin esterase